MGRPGLGVGRFWRVGVTIKDLPPTIFVLFLALELLAALAANPQHGAPDILYAHKKHLQSECVNTVNRYKGGGGGTNGLYNYSKN